MKPFIVAGLLGALFLGTITTSAEAGEHGRGGGGGHYNGHYEGRRNGGDWAGPAIVGGVSGLALGALGLYTYGPLFYDSPPPYYPPEAYYPPEPPPGYYYASDGLLYPYLR